MWEHPAVVVALLGLAINLVVTIVGGIWKLSRLELGLRSAINEASDKTDEKIERQARYFGETVAAVRQKITDVEIFSRDTFVRKDELSEHLDMRLDRIEAELKRGTR